MKVKQESEKALNIQETKGIRTVILWQIDGEQMETVTDFFLLGSKVTADSDCSHKIKRHLLLGEKAMASLDRVSKSRDIILPTKVHTVKAMVFPGVMYDCEGWTIKKAECQRIDAFKLWCCRRFFSSLDSTEIKPVNLKGNQFWILIGRTDAEAESSILWPPEVKSWFIGIDPYARKDWKVRGEGGNRGWDCWVPSMTQWT